MAFLGDRVDRLNSGVGSAKPRFEVVGGA